MPRTRIRELRKNAGLTLKNLGDLVGTTPQSISRMEMDKMTVSIDWLFKIAKALKVDPRDLIRTPGAEWRKSGGRNGGRYYQFFGEMFPVLNDNITKQFNLGFGAKIIYEDMSREELGKLIHDAIAIGYVVGNNSTGVQASEAENV